MKVSREELAAKGDPTALSISISSSISWSSASLFAFKTSLRNALARFASVSMLDDTASMSAFLWIWRSLYSLLTCGDDCCPRGKRSVNSFREMMAGS